MPEADGAQANADRPAGRCPAGRAEHVMSQEIMEERVGRLEGKFADLRSEVAVLGRDVSDLKKQGDAVLGGIKDLQSRDAKRPEGMTLKSLAAACAGIGTIALVGWWLIEHAPAVTALRERITDLDHPTRGSVTILQREVGELQQWRPTVMRFRETP